MIYQELIEQYNNLTDEEKNALLVYKSRLGLAINSLNNNINEVKEIYEQYKSLLNDPKNFFVKMTIFKNISFDNFKSFVDSLQQVEEKIIETSFKIKLPKGVTLYRAISIKEDIPLEQLTKSKIVSTSLNIDQCSKFLIHQPGYKHYLYQINLDESSVGLICPYAVLINTKTNQLSLTQKTDQEEFILLKDNYDFNENFSTQTELVNGEKLTIIIVDAKLKDKKITPSVK